MSKVIKLQKDKAAAAQKAKPSATVKVETTPTPVHDDFLSFMDFWQRKEDGVAVPEEKPKSPAELAREEADAILAEARAEAARVMQEAYDSGYAEGEAAGLADGKKVYDEQVAKLDALLAALNGQRAEVMKNHEQDLLTLVHTMVDRLVHHEVSVNPLVIRTCLAEAMEFVVENSVVQVHLHSEDFNRIKKASLEDSSLLAGKNRVQLVEDPNISEGGCLLKTDFGEIDATLENCREKLYAAVDAAFLAALAAGQ